jgi:branched-subunit amino acid ABC-type transport system permease component
MTQSHPFAQEPQSDDIDRLLREYFGSKIPHSFPPLPLESMSPAASPRIHAPSTLQRGRLVLAACIAAVVLGLGYLLSTTSAGLAQKPVGLNDSSAKGGAPHDTVRPQR